MARSKGPRIRSQRVAEQIRITTAEILQRDVKDPRLGMVTCTRVDLSNDLRHARLYVGVLGDDAERERALTALEQATGYVRRLLSERLSLRVSPEVVFVFDPSIEYGIRLETLIEETKRRSPPDETVNADPPPEASGEDESTDGEPA